MTALDLSVLAEVLLKLMSRIIEFVMMMMKDALRARKGKERSN